MTRGEVIGTYGRKVEVGRKEHGPDAVGHDQAGLQNTENRDRGDCGDDDDDGGGGQDPRGPTGVEIGEANLGVAGYVVEQQARDEEPRNDEKDVNTDESSAKPWNLGVIKDDHAHRDGAQTLNIGPKGSRRVATRGPPPPAALESPVPEVPRKAIIRGVQRRSGRFLEANT